MAGRVCGRPSRCRCAGPLRDVDGCAVALSGSPVSSKPSEPSTSRRLSRWRFRRLLAGTTAASALPQTQCCSRRRSGCLTPASSSTTACVPGGSGDTARDRFWMALESARPGRVMAEAAAPVQSGTCRVVDVEANCGSVPDVRAGRARPRCAPVRPARCGGPARRSCRAAGSGSGSRAGDPLSVPAVVIGPAGPGALVCVG